MSTTTSPAPILIAGAGPTGLFLAYWLARAGVPLRIIDAKRGPTQESRAIAVQARTLEFYDQLGLGADALARGRNFGGVSLWESGRLAGTAAFTNVSGSLTPHPYMYILTQDQNEALLIAHLQTLGINVEWETELTGFTQDADGITATLRHADQTTTFRAAYLAGCDGAHSAVRHGMGMTFAGDTYPNTYFVADVTATGKLRSDDINLCMGDASFAVYFPMPGQDHHRVLGQVPAGVGEHPTFEDVRTQAEANGIAQVQSVHWFATYRLHHRVAAHFRVGRAFLLGDAGHVHTPVGGQGMNTGLGDAVNLAWKLAQVIGGGNAALLDSYEAERLPFALSLVKTTDRIFNGAASTTPLNRFIRTRVLPLMISSVGRIAAARRAMFMLISQLRITYPKSSLSQGKAGRVKGGDRLPWVPNTTSSNFALLQSLQWQMHIYGDAPGAVQAWCDQQHVPLHVFPFTPAAQHAGLAKDAPYLVRPDGYVGLAAPQFAADVFDAYAAQWLPSITTSHELRTPAAVG
jgi:2-polyprenyl-6-methoxyphenol hydroxylase-like FAD-dependent oxidoreductase